MPYIALNNAASTLSGGLSAVATSVPVQAGHGARFAVGANYSYVTLQDTANNIEVAKLTGVTGDVLTVVRAQDGTAARVWAIGDVISCRPCAAGFNDFAVGPQVNTSASKTTPVDADEVGITDSAAAFGLKKLTWANLKATLFAGFQMTGGVIYKAGLNNVASASPLVLTGLNANTAHVTGTTGFSALTMTSGQVVDLIFDGVLTLTHHATNNNLQGGLPITTAPNDRARYWYDGTTVWCVGYQKASGTAIGIAAATAANDSGFADDSVKTASTNWVRGAMSAIATAAGFSISLGSNGYCKFPSWLGGWIIQWAVVTLSVTANIDTGSVAASLPIAFPNNHVQTLGSIKAMVSNNVYSMRFSPQSLSQFNVGCLSTTTQSITFAIIAIGN